MLNEPRTIPEDLMLELEQSIETCQRIFAKIQAINERNQTEEWREWQKDYERSIAL